MVPFNKFEKNLDPPFWAKRLQEQHEGQLMTRPIGAVGQLNSSVKVKDMKEQWNS